MAQMKYFYELTISSSPHVHAPVTTQTIMRDVLIALAPAALGGIYFFGLRALLVLLVSVAGCVFFEWLSSKMMKAPCRVYDLSAVVTGVLIAFVCPVTIPYWCVLIGDFFAIVIVKQLFGGVGRNLVNPALAARAFLFSWPALMTTWVKPGFANGAPLLAEAPDQVLDGMTAATPLAQMAEGQIPVLRDLLIGNVGGCIGETSVILLAIGFVYLLIRRVVNLRIPVAYLGTVALLTVLFPLNGANNLQWMLCQLFSGGLVLGALFMATDYVTSPVTKLGQVVFGIGCGVLTVVIRYFGGYPEGVSYAILIMNCCVVLLDRIGRPKKFGMPKKGVAKG